jgi:hypothetical protein
MGAFAVGDMTNKEKSRVDRLLKHLVQKSVLEGSENGNKGIQQKGMKSSQNA